MTCPFCGEEHPDSTRFCPNTGKKIEQRVCRNPQCDYREPLPAYAVFCPSCGAPLEPSAGGQAPESQSTALPKESPTPGNGTKVAPSSPGIGGKPAGFNTGSGFGFQNQGFGVGKKVPLTYAYSVDTTARFIDLSGYDTSETCDFNSLFYRCSHLEGVNLEGWDTSNVDDMSLMFSECSMLRSLDLSHFDTRRVTTMRGMFCACSALGTLDLSGFDMSNVKDTSNMFWGCTSLRRIVMRGCNQLTVEAVWRELRTLHGVEIIR